MVSLLHQHTGSTICRWLLDQCALDDKRLGIQWQKISVMDPDATPHPALDSEAPSEYSSSLTSLSEPVDYDMLSFPPNSPSSTMSNPITAAPMNEIPEMSLVSETYQPTQISWPGSRIPVEIFELITSFLSRAEVRTLRLVNREFESKVSAKYFKNVVVPFRSELYGDFMREQGGARQHPSSALFSNGSRIFESFGPHILRFALSLEIDEDALAYPPIKPAQAVVPSFWGIYRWPHQSYTRYSDLEGIEQTADETQRMKDALKCLTKVTNMGLCCDAGLGFLTRPDAIARSATSQQYPVFATQNWRREQRATKEPDDDDDQFVTIADFNGFGTRRRNFSGADPFYLQRTVLEKMAVDAGYRGNQIGEAIQILLEAENTNLSFIDFDERAALKIPVLETSSSDLAEQHLLAMLGASDGDADTLERPDPRRFPLVPAFLTRAQKELLLELEWAHRAMIQSYVIAMVDNAAIGCYSHLTTLTIAKIPSCHVHIFYRHAFWESFPNLTNVSLGVIADWRKIQKPTPGFIEDMEVSPVKAVSVVFTLLQDYIGKQSKIESLHFEWICGGEFAPSSFQRNQYILPAPFFLNPQEMMFPAINTIGGNNLLSLPRIKHLSLKNCWSSPHVLVQTVRQMALASLEKLELESVSLSGQPTSNPQFPLGLHNGQVANVNHMIMQNGFVGPAQQAHLLPGPQAGAQPNNAAIPPPAQPPVLPQPAETLLLPDLLTWAGFLEHFSPEANIRRVVEDEIDWNDSRWPSMLALAFGFVPKCNRLYSDERRYKIKCLSFRSCGYVCVDANNLNTRALLPPGAHGVVPPTNNQTTPQRVMQRCRDKELGQILPYIRPQEVFNLTHAFGMEMGWDNVYSDKMIEDAIADGVDFPGIGRFSGVLESSSSTRKWSTVYASSLSDVMVDSGPDSSGDEVAAASIL